MFVYYYSLTMSAFPDLSLEQKVKLYVSTKNPKLVILTPCYGSMCFVGYVSCLMATTKLFDSLGFPIKVEFCRNDSLVSRARNNLIAKAMSDPDATHFLFIDNDITWDPVDVLKLVLADKHIVGGVYPIKHYAWEKLTAGDNVPAKWIAHKNQTQLAKIPNEDLIQHKLLRYNINSESNVLEVNNNLTQVKHLATGFMMIQRTVIDKMSQAFPSTKYVDDVGFLVGDENRFAYALFDCGVEEGHYFSEDWLFCSRWSKMGGKIWADVTINLTHTGIQDFRGSFISSIM